MPSTTISLRARYSETDQMGVINHSRYLDWFSEARIQWLRERGFSYREWEDQGIVLPVIRLEVEYRQSVRFDDLIDLNVVATKVTSKKIFFEYQLLRLGESMAWGRTLHYFMIDGKIRALHQKILDQLLPG